MTIINTLFSEKKVFIIFCVLEIIIISFLLLFSNRKKNIYHSNTIKLTNKIEVPIPVGDGQYGTSWWLDKKDYSKIFKCNILDRNKKYNTVSFSSGGVIVNFEKKEMIGDKNLAGSHFILRNEQGDIVEEWTSTDTAKTIEKLTPGQYTLSEVQAPDGYVLNKSALTFEVAKTGDIQVVTMFDALEVKVPNTSQNSLLYLFIGTITIMTGLSIFGYTYYKKKA